MNMNPSSDGIMKLNSKAGFCGCRTTHYTVHTVHATHAIRRFADSQSHMAAAHPIYTNARY